MPLALLFATPSLTTYYDAPNDILLLDWQGPLTLSAVQLASVQLAQALLVRRYERVLVSTQQVSAVSSEVAGWLGHMLLPSLPVAGIKWLAWAGSVSPGNVALAQQVLSQLPGGHARLWADVEQATNWLRHLPEASAAPAPRSGPTRNLPLLRRRTAILHWRVLASLARHPYWLLAEPAARYAPEELQALR